MRTHHATTISVFTFKLCYAYYFFFFLNGSQRRRFADIFREKKITLLRAQVYFLSFKVWGSQDVFFFTQPHLSQTITNFSRRFPFSYLYQSKVHFLKRRSMQSLAADSCLSRKMIHLKIALSLMNHQNVTHFDGLTCLFG